MLEVRAGCEAGRGHRGRAGLRAEQTACQCASVCMHSVIDARTLIALSTEIGTVHAEQALRR